MPWICMDLYSCYRFRCFKQPTKTGCTVVHPAFVQPTDPQLEFSFYNTWHVICRGPLGSLVLSYQTNVILLDPFAVVGVVARSVHDSICKALWRKCVVCNDCTEFASKPWVRLLHVSRIKWTFRCCNLRIHDYNTGLPAVIFLHQDLRMIANSPPLPPPPLQPGRIAWSLRHRSCNLPIWLSTTL